MKLSTHAALVVILLLSVYISSAQQPILALPMNGNALDTTGNNTDVTVFGATLTTNRLNQPNRAYFFDGTDDYISIPYNALYNISPNGQFTISLWAQPMSFSTAAALFVKSPFVANHFLSNWDYGMYLVNNRLMSGYANNAPVQATAANGLIANTCWYHLAATYNDGRWALYINGRLVATDNSRTRFILQSTASIAIGKKGEANGDYYHGKVDDVKFYNVALSQSQITQLGVNAGSDVSACKGAIVQLNGVGLGTPSWSPTTGLSNPNVFNPTLTVNTTTNYVLTVMSASGCVNRDTVRVEVNNPFSYTRVTNVNQCYNDSADFSVIIPNATIEWYPEQFFSNTVGSHTRFKVNTSRFLYYKITSGQCSLVDSFFVNVRGLTPIKTNLTMCIDTISLSSRGDANFIWSPNYRISNTTAKNVNIWPDKDTTYIVNFTSNGCITTDTIRIQAGTIALTTSNSHTICEGDSVQIFVNGANRYFWNTTLSISDTTSQSPWVKPDTTTIYYVIGKSGLCLGQDSIVVVVNPKLIADAGSDRIICNNDSVILSSSGGQNYLWQPSSGLSSTTVSNPKALPSVTTEYVLKVASGSCIAYDTMVIYVALIQTNVSGPHTICLGDSVLITAMGATNILWEYNTTLSDTTVESPIAKPLTSTTYFVKISNDLCAVKDSVIVNVVNNVKIDAGSDTSICFGDSIQLNLNGASSYVWQPIDGLDNPSIANPKASPNISTRYIVSSTDQCTVQDTIYIEVIDIPIINLAQDIVRCRDQQVFMNPTVSGADSFYWTPQLGLSSPSILNPMLMGNISSVYYLKAINSSSGCFATDSIQYDYRSPLSSFSLNTIKGNVPFSLTSTNNSNPIPLSYKWIIKRDASVMELASQEINQLITRDGKYQIKLIVIDDKGCRDTSIQFVEATATNTIFIPNGFTPNFDNINDVFEVVFDSNSIVKIEGSIWNRWGGKMYEFNYPSMAPVWDGKENGSIVSEGVYVYFIKVTDIAGEQKSYHGTVTLLR